MKVRFLNKPILLYSICFLVLQFFSSSLKAQETTGITGIVRNTNGVALENVSVTASNSKNKFSAGTQTDSNGVFRFPKLPSGGNYNFTFSHVGYADQTFSGYAIKPNTTISLVVKMEEKVNVMNDVVVIGYGSVKKSDLTGSVATISEKDFNKGVSTNADQLIQGKAPGVTILQSNAQPGGATTIQIRGITSLNASNQPLYVIDGMPIDNVPLNPPTNDLSKNAVFSPPPPNPLNTINPADIASIDILKDASATAIYGSRGSNGVVLITTKHGTKGKPSVSYNGSVGIQNIAKEYNLLNAYEYATAYNKYYDFYKSINPADPIFNNSVVKKFTDDEINNFKNNGGTDWFNILTRKGLITNNQVSVSGGSENSTYYASLGYLNHKGVVSLSDLERISARLNLTQKIAKIFEFGINLSVATSATDNIPLPYGHKYRPL